MTLRQCEWCYSATPGSDGKIVHLNTCCLRPVKVVEFSEIQDKRYCAKCREHYTGSPSMHFTLDCVYEIGCPVCKQRYLDKYHAENCRRAEVWKAADLPPLSPPTPPLTSPIMSQASPKPPEHYPMDYLLSFRKPAQASSLESGAFEAAAVTGRGTSSRWSSHASDHQWITIDLEDICSVSRVVLEWEHAHALEYRIKVSINRVVWTEVHQTFFGRGGIETIRFRPIDARYVMMSASKRATQWGYSLWSFQVFGNEIDEDLPMTQKILKKWGSRKLPKDDITIVDERKVPWLSTSAPTATGK